MFHSRLLLMVFLFSCSFAHAQMQNDSITRKYLICKSTGFNFYSKIFVEGKRLLAVSNDGKKCRGHLKIINDTLFSLTNSWNFKCDTFSINQIRKLKNPNLLLTGLGIVAIPYGLWVAHDGYTMLGTGLLWDFLGKIYIIEGVSYTIVGPIAINGPKIDLTFYNLKIYQTKGYKLKKKHLKYLYPNN